MARFTWHSGCPPPDLEITQVYGLLFTDCERLLLFVAQGGNFSLPGGSPEAYDAGMEATLRREVLEEVNTEINEPVIIGYQTGSGGESQVRMAAMIKEIKPAQADPATGLTYRRLLATPGRAIELLGWHDTGAAQVGAAVNLVRERFGTSIYKCTKCFGEPGKDNEQIYI